jgi:Protein of unknown function (DUF1566)
MLSACEAEDFTWQEAVDYCNELELDRYDNWGIPSLKELYSISDFSSGWPYLDTDYFDLASGQVIKDEQFWSSNYYMGVTVEGGSASAFGVNHVTGHIKAYSAEASGPVGGKYVRAVRGGDYGVNKYLENGDATISDHATSLMWAQNDNGEGLNWPAIRTGACLMLKNFRASWRALLQFCSPGKRYRIAVFIDRVGPAGEYFLAGFLYADEVGLLAGSHINISAEHKQACWFL